jgi:hypothetical protein
VETPLSVAQITRDFLRNTKSTSERSHSHQKRSQKRKLSIFGNTKQVIQDCDTVFDNSIPFRKNDPLRILECSVPGLPGLTSSGNPKRCETASQSFRSFSRENEHISRRITSAESCVEDVGRRLGCARPPSYAGPHGGPIAWACCGGHVRGRPGPRARTWPAGWRKVRRLPQCTQIGRALQEAWAHSWAA